VPENSAGTVGRTEECVVGTIAYVSNAESKEIFAFDMDPARGTLSLIERVAVPGTDLPSPTSLPLAVSPDHRFLYAALRSPPFAASSFAIDQSSGRLSQVAVTPLLCAMAYIVTDRSGRFLLAASYTNARLAIYPIDAAGRIEARPTQITPTGPNAHCILVDAANRFAYSAVLGADHVVQLLFDPATGTFAPNAPPTVTTRARSGPRHLAFHPNGRFIYLLNQTDATIVAYRIEPGSGVLSEIETVTTLPAHFLGEANAADIHAHAGRTVSLCQRAADQHAGRIPRRFGERLPCSNRALEYGNHAARLRHRPTWPFPARGRAGFEPGERPCDRSGGRRADAARSVSSGRHA
jgi:6-phosphogluconolactonase